MTQPSPRRPRVCAVNYLNTVPLVWGMLHGPQQGLFDLDFRIPAGCADQIASGAADIGLIPSFELTRQDLRIADGIGIACHGAVRSILLVSSRPPSQIRTLAADSSSRTSVELAKMILKRKYGVCPNVFRCPPDLDAMLRVADAALIIGDPALRIDPARLPFGTYDLGAEWAEMTGLPMVFAVWAGRKETLSESVCDAFRASYQYGVERIDQIVSSESARREFAPELVRRYLTQHIVHALGPRDYEGMALFLSYARELQGSEMAAH